MRLRRIFVGALITSLIWLIIIGSIGGLWIARRVLHRVDTINDKARAIVGGVFRRGCRSPAPATNLIAWSRI